MNYNTYKIFIKNNEPKLVECNNDNYYSNIKKQKEDGYNQLILELNLMMSLIDYYILYKKMTIKSIEFIKINPKNEKIIKDLLKSKDIMTYFKLRKELFCINKKSFVEIKKITLINLSNDDPMSIIFQINGLIGINSKKHNKEKNMISNLIYNLLV